MAGQRPAQGGMLFGTEVQSLIVRHGYTAVFLVVMLEGAGSPLPGESALVFAAIYAGATGHLRIAFVVGVAALGAIFGGSCGFWFGRSVGAKFFARYGKYIGLTPNRLALGHYLFVRYGGRIVFFGRFIAVLRVLAALLAGVNQYDWRSFFLFNAAGSIAWAVIMGFGGYFFGNAMRRASGPLEVIGLIAAVGVLFIFWLWFRQQEKKMEERLTTVALQEHKRDLDRQKAS
jgi:membrane protein DedA with SNARE-associated domain